LIDPYDQPEVTAFLKNVNRIKPYRSTNEIERGKLKSKA